MDLNTIWFLLVGILIIGYAILDGYDLGIGALHFFAKNERERRIHLNAIGPLWDGNEVWLLTGGGALFAAFPVVYATVFSGLYTALMLLLAALIFRAVAIEFRSKVEDSRWRSFWDYAFSIGSILPAVLLGIAFGNILRGLPLDQQGNYTGSFFGLLNPFSVLVGLVSLAAFTAHGAIFLAMKSDGELLKRLSALIPKLWLSFVALYLVASVTAVFTAPLLFDDSLSDPLFWILLLPLVGAMLYMPVAAKSGKFFRAFIASSVTIALMIGEAALSLFPRLVPSLTDVRYSLDIYNAASTPQTQTIMLIIALIGMPLVLLYTVYIHRVFRGQVILHEDSY
ncbi:MAG TPA: cytochrome d ubiquinol oxidase subunit II [bacterium]|jgi:cytochrome d ubiquinol oxidase subunit II